MTTTALLVIGVLMLLVLVGLVAPIILLAIGASYFREQPTAESQELRSATEFAFD